MHIKKHILLAIIYLLFLPLLNPAFAGKLIIKGDFPEARGEKVFLIAFSDFLSLKEEIIAQTTIDSTGHFEITTELRYPAPLTIEVAFYRFTIYAMPGETYILKAPDFSVVENGNPLMMASRIPCRVTGSRADSLVRLIEAKINRALDSAGHEIYLKNRTEVLDSLLSQTKRLFIHQNLPEVWEDLRFRLYSLYPSPRLPDEVHNYSEINPRMQSFYYMQWMEDYLYKILTRQNPLTISSDFTKKLVIAVNKEENLTKTDSLISDYLQLTNKALHDLTLLVALKSLFRTPIYQNKSVIKLLNEFRARTTDKDCQSMAENSLEHLLRLKPGYPLPDFELLTLSQDIITPKSFPGKPLYIVFARTTCRTCLDNLELLRPLYKRFNGKFEIIAIFTGHDLHSEENTARQMNYPWPVVIAGREYEFLHRYAAYSLPLEVMADAQGQILAFPAYRADEGLEAVLEKMLLKSATPKPRKY